MKKIGFIDYYLSEWHANHYPEWIRQANEALGTDYRVTMAWAECEISPIDGVSTDEWCEKNGVTRAESISALCAGCDAIFILAPSNPEKHLPYAKEAFPFAKPTFVDKTFAQSYVEALELVELANRFGTPVFSSSALRYAEELERFEGVKDLIVTAGGNDLAEYLIHPVEMAVRLIKDQAVSAKAVRVGRCQYLLEAATANGKSVTVVYSKRMAYTLAGELEDGKSLYTAVRSDFFGRLTQAIVGFFESGVAPVPLTETLEVMHLCDLMLAAAKEAEKR